MAGGHCARLGDRNHGWDRSVIWCMSTVVRLPALASDVYLLDEPQLTVASKFPIEPRYSNEAFSASRYAQLALRPASMS